MLTFNCPIKLLIIFILTLSGNAYSQESCEVKLESIKSVYSGGCLNKNANGHGKSIGIDQYEGEFKEGYPDGTGMYVWKDGHYFIGSFKRGNKEGRGEMYYESISGDDSLITGFWRNDKYWGKYEIPYKLISSSGLIFKVNITLKKESQNGIAIKIRDQGGTTGVYSLRHTSIKDLIVIKGEYVKSYYDYGFLENVTYPFEAILYLTNGDNTRILLNEYGGYEILIDIK